jgi:inner membrane transporter RhtA
MPAPVKATFTPALLVIASMVSLTLGASVAKTLFAATGPSGISAVRIGVGAALLALWWRPWRARISGNQARVILCYGLCLGAMNLLFYQAVARLPIGLAIAIEFLGPLSIALIYSKKALDLFLGFPSGGRGCFDLAAYFVAKRDRRRGRALRRGGGSRLGRLHRA